MKLIYRIFAILLAAFVSLTITGCEEFRNIQNPQEDTTDGPENPEEPKEPVDREFVILFTNDFHSQIDPLSETHSTHPGRGGIKRIKVLVDSVRAVEPAVLLTDSGDLVQGTYYFSLLNGVVEMMIIDELGYDVRTLGNHEFDKKMIGLGDMLSMSSVPVVASNYDFSNTAIAKYINSSTMIESGGIKVGFIGLNVRLFNLVDPAACEGVVWQDAINVADAEAKKLRDQGADMVIALSHLGYRDSDAIYYDKGIAANTRYIDVILGGHSHSTLYKPDYCMNLDGKAVPIVQTGSNGLNLGHARIKLSKEGELTFNDYKLIPVKSHLDSKIDKAFSDMIDVYAAQVTSEMEKVIGHCPRAIRKYTPESPLGNLTADGLIWMAKEYFNVDADVSLYNNGGIRAELPAGDLTIGNVYATYPFDNALSIVTMKGSDLMSLFEYSAGSGGLPINKEVRLVIKDNAVYDVTVKGEHVDPDRIYTVATIDYLVNIGRSGFENVISRTDSQIIIRDYFVEYYSYLASQNKGEIQGYFDGRTTILE